MRSVGRRAAVAVWTALLVIVLPLAVIRLHDIWYGDGKRAFAPISLATPGIVTVPFRQPVAKMVSLEVFFVVPRTEWRGPVGIGEARGGSAAVPVPGMTLDYRWGVRERNGGRPADVVRGRQTGLFNARYSDWWAPEPKGDVEVVVFIGGFSAAKGVDYDVVFEVLTPVSAPHAERARLSFIPIARDGLQQAVERIEAGVWLAALAGLVGAVVAAVTRLRRPPSGDR